MSKKKKKYSKKSKIPPGKIRCPECGRIIEEGLVFCPECGNRIPPWAQFNSNSSPGMI
ncbi:MAG: zinc-ribbon domain-containing protein [Promethearchaeota archaeon]|nr:MAG: zinc-ribbon domain-containing protein [Candidatus Lokiarchaeota archaeon]